MGARPPVFHTRASAAAMMGALAVFIASVAGLSSSGPAQTTGGGQANPGPNTASYPVPQGVTIPSEPRPLTINNTLALAPHDLGELSAAAAAYLLTRPPEWGVAVAMPAEGVVYESNGEEPFAMASVAKVVIMAALLDAHAQAGTPLTADESSELSAMITESDNDAASALWDAVGGADGVTTYLRKAGVQGVFPAKPPLGWGDSSATPAGLAQLLTKLWSGDLLPAPQRAQALQLMADVDEDQRWGSTAALPPDEPGAAVKDGWYPAITGWRVASVVIAGQDTEQPVIIVAMTRNQDSMQTGVDTISGVAERIGATIFGTGAAPPVSTQAPPSTTVTLLRPAGVGAAQAEGSCASRSDLARRAEAWRCTVDGQEMDPCFGPGPGTVVCTAADGSQVGVRLTGPLPAVSLPSDWAHPWQVRLAGGDLCTSTRSAQVDDDGDRLTYQCASGAVLVGPLQRGVVWFGLMSDASLSQFTTVRIEAVTY